MVVSPGTPPDPFKVEAELWFSNPSVFGWAHNLAILQGGGNRNEMVAVLRSGGPEVGLCCWLKA